MRYVLASCLSIMLCVSANAGTVNHSKYRHHAGVYRGYAVGAPERVASPYGAYDRVYTPYAPRFDYDQIPQTSQLGGQTPY